MRRKCLEATICDLEDIPETVLRLKAKYCEYETQTETLEIASGTFRGQFFVNVWKL